LRISKLFFPPNTHFVWPGCRFYKPTKIERKIYTGFWSEEEYLKELDVEGE